MNKIQVITKIPDVDDNDGNLCDETFIADICGTNNKPIYRPYKDIGLAKNKVNHSIPVKLEVFHLGEIIIVDDCEREIGGMQRKASKWFVEYRIFFLEDIDKAIKLSKKILKL